MRILVLGGTAWLGGTIAAEAVTRGHETTCLARGESGDPPQGSIHVRANRSSQAAYTEVAGQDWDCVVDVTRQRGQLRTAVDALGARTSTYVFVSSGSVYADHSQPGMDESASTLPPLDKDVMESMHEYGHAKVACERHLLNALGPDRVLIARAGLIGGPGDVSGRTGYWPLRFARPSTSDGAVLVPNLLDSPTQVIDVRDLASWLVDCAENRSTGIVNASGDVVSLGEHLRIASEVGGAGHAVPVDSDWLKDQGVESWMGPRSLPLWLPDPEYAGFASRDNQAAKRIGLRFRPLEETLADACRWDLQMGADRARGAGLTPDEERDLLRRWQTRD